MPLAHLQRTLAFSGLENYYCSSVAKALVEHYAKRNLDIATMYPAIVTDVQVRATMRAFSKALVDGRVAARDILRFRISLPIKRVDEKLSPLQTAIFSSKVPHGFDFLHWWYISFCRLGLI